jgi:AbrB family looped-hinge helix DNA binding protein
MLEMRTTLGKGGRLVIPAAYRKALGVEPGDDLIVILEQGELRIVTPAQAVQRARMLVRQFIQDGTPLVEELLEDRRKENAHE